MSKQKGQLKELEKLMDDISKGIESASKSLESASKSLEFAMKAADKYPSNADAINVVGEHGERWNHFMDEQGLKISSMGEKICDIINQLGIGDNITAVTPDLGKEIVYQ